MNRLSDPKMNQEFFKNLPAKIVIDILSRLPARAIVSCKCVCKSWLNLVESLEFAKIHLSKSVPGLAIFQNKMHSEWYKIFEFEDGHDLEHHELHYNLVTECSFPYAELQGSLNGLLFLLALGATSDALYVFNPITRDYVELHCPVVSVHSSYFVSFGFGMSKMTGQLKVVRIIHVIDQKFSKITKSECQVYTLGTASWRSIADSAPLMFAMYHGTFGTFMNGNLHWLLSDCQWISCLDLETELFSTFSPPPLPEGSETQASLFALEDCLCLCDNTSYDEIVIWLMKEYGVEKSWTKEFVISKFPDFIGRSDAVVRPIKVFKDGDILMAWGNSFLFYYSKKNKTSEIIDMFEPGLSIYATLYTPSFLSLKSFGMEKITSF